MMYDFRLQRPLLPPRVPGRRLVILGSGPSLREALDHCAASWPADVDFLSVNDGYRDASFDRLKPSCHVIADPIYWDPNCKPAFADPLVEKLRVVDWPITIFLPLRSRGLPLHHALSGADVSVAFYSSTPVSGFPSLQQFAFSQRLGMPRAQNVLVAAIAVGMWMQYRRIALIGADHSWHQTIVVDDRNVLGVRQFHSYDEHIEVAPFLKPDGVSRQLGNQTVQPGDIWTVAEIFRAWAAVHESYEQLQVLAVKSQCQIYNCSTVSFIDAFPRVPLSTFVESVC